MLLTEQEAETKRCQESFPVAVGLSAGGHAFATTWQPLPPNCGGAGYAVHTAPLYCIGSACMAWRWAVEGNQFAGYGQSKLGYCGKAGPAIGFTE